MAPTTLVTNWIDDGRTLIQALRVAGVDVHLAFWLYLDEPKEWRLYLSTPLVDMKGPLRTYKVIQPVLAAMPPGFSIRLPDIAVTRPGDRMVQALERFVARNPEPLATRVRGVALDGIYFEDSYVYRDVPGPVARADHVGSVT